MTLKIVYLFEYGYDVCITVEALAGRPSVLASVRPSVTLPMHPIIFCRNPAAALIERRLPSLPPSLPPIRLRSDVGDGWPRISLPMAHQESEDSHAGRQTETGTQQFPLVVHARIRVPSSSKN